ncbi:MAG TPA: tyrosine-type recombinase/integrase [Bryobacteraceae bacterium]|nr:tyrosine-type recombinase/integrase [Bryobacteraceae bacterium]
MKKRLADGSIKTYEYERGGKAAAPRERDTITMLIQAYQGSPEWRRLSAATQDRYIRYLRPLMRIGDTRAADLTRRDVTTIRNAIDETGKPAAANAFVRASSALYAWGMDNSFVETNPTFRIKPIPGGHFPAWTPNVAATALDVLPEHLRRLVLVALYTGQRRGDLCRLAWSNYDGARLRLTQEKTDVSLVIPIHPILKTAMDGWERRATTILTNARGWPWKPGSASHGMKLAIDRLDLPSGWNIHGLRKLAAANLAEAGCSMNEIAAITGHKTTAMISFYTASADQERMATAAIHRLPVGRK